MKKLLSLTDIANEIGQMFHNERSYAGFINVHTRAAAKSVAAASDAGVDTLVRTHPPVMREKTIVTNGQLRRVRTYRFN